MFDKWFDPEERAAAAIRRELDRCNELRRTKLLEFRRRAVAGVREQFPDAIFLMQPHHDQFVGHSEGFGKIIYGKLSDAGYPDVRSDIARLPSDQIKVWLDLFKQQCCEYEELYGPSRNIKFQPHDLPFINGYKFDTVASHNLVRMMIWKNGKNILSSDIFSTSRPGAAVAALQQAIIEDCAGHPSTYSQITIRLFFLAGEDEAREAITYRHIYADSPREDARVGFSARQDVLVVLGNFVMRMEDQMIKRPPWLNRLSTDAKKDIEYIWPMMFESSVYALN